MTEDELRRILGGLVPPDEIFPASSLEGFVGAPAIILDESPLCRGYATPRQPETPVQLSREGVKVFSWSSQPVSYDRRELEEASASGQSLLDRYTEMIEGVREREEQAMRERMSKDALAFLQSLGDQPEPRMDRVFETTNDDGEKMFFVMAEPDPERLKIPMSMSFELPELDPMRFVFGQRLGGFVQRDPIDRIITVTSMPMPDVPGVEAMLADGWVWTGWRFARDQRPRKEWTGVRTVALEEDAWAFHAPVFVRTGPKGDPRLGQYRCDDDGGNAVEVDGARWIEIFSDRRGRDCPSWGYLARIGHRTTAHPGRYASFVSDGRVRGGRYADRVPTNRKRKRERAKASRRKRKRMAKLAPKKLAPTRAPEESGIEALPVFQRRALALGRLPRWVQALFPPRAARTFFKHRALGPTWNL